MKLNNDSCLSAKQIVCVLSRGQAPKVLEIVQKHEHVLAAEYLGIRHIVEGKDWHEKDLLRMVVLPQFADEVFEELYYLAHINSDDEVSLYQHDVPWVTAFHLPSLPEEGISVEALEEMDTLPEGMTQTSLDELKKLANLI